MIRFSAEQFPERERFDGWCETFVRNIANAGITRLDDRSRPFEAAVETLALGRVSVAHVTGTPVRFTRTPKQVASGNHDFTLIVTREGQTRVEAGDTRSTVGKYGAQLVTHWQPGHVDFCTAGDATGTYRAFRYQVPRNLVYAAIANPEALCFKALTGNAQALDYLVQYTDQVLLRQDFDDPRLAERAGAHVFDLVATILGPPRGAPQIVERRGIRAARLAAILAQIHTEYLDRHFSVEVVARRHGVSPRYVQRLLDEHGETFSHRVLRLRLDRVAEMLAAPPHAHQRIGDIAAAAGFSDLSYFNRTFKRRFGESPRRFRRQPERDAGGSRSSC